MTQFALFYDRQDLTPLAAEMTNPSLTPQQRSLANQFWNGGLNSWASAPVAPLQFQEGDPDTRIVVVNVQNHTLADLINLLRQVGSTVAGAAYLLSLADDMSRSSGAIEPWPQV